MRELSLHILDILQNSVEAGSTLVELAVEENLTADWLTIRVSDNGRGIPADVLPHVFDPFYTSRKTRRVGLGLPLLKAAAERCEGDVTLVSEVGAGTTIQARFRHSHIDRAPLGDLPATLMSFILGGMCDLHYVHRVTGRSEDGRLADWDVGAEIGEFEFHTIQIKAASGDVPLSHPAVRAWLQEFITEGEAELRGA